MLPRNLIILHSITLIKRSMVCHNFTNQANTVNLTHAQNYSDLAIGLKFSSPTRENFYWKFFRAGYRYGFNEVAWKMRGGQITDAPMDRNNQFYLQFCLGFYRQSTGG
jgi:hypothetical protein